MRAAARLSAHLVEDVSGIETIKAFGGHAWNEVVLAQAPLTASGAGARNH